MQYIRSKCFDIILVAWTLALGLGTPALMLARSNLLTRTYARFWAKGVIWLLWYVVGMRYKVVGKIPATRDPKIIVCNHQSAWETLFLATIFDNIAFVAKKELVRIPIFGWYLKNYPMILINRGGGRATMIDLLRQAETAVKEGRSILIFPEGTRLNVDDEKPYHFGVVALYKRLGVPVVTIAHNSGCYWSDDYVMKYSGMITVNVIEEIPPGLDETVFQSRIEDSINAEKKSLASLVDNEVWRTALG